MTEQKTPSFAERMIVGYGLLKEQIGKYIVEASLCCEQHTWRSPSFIILKFEDRRVGNRNHDYPKTRLKIWDNGQSCCEYRYITTDDNLADLMGETFLGFDLKDGSQSEENEILFFEIQTRSKTVTFATHNEHNGYYGGFNLIIEHYEKESE